MSPVARLTLLCVLMCPACISLGKVVSDDESSNEPAGGGAAVDDSQQEADSGGRDSPGPQSGGANLGGAGASPVGSGSTGSDNSSGGNAPGGGSTGTCQGTAACESDPKPCAPGECLGHARPKVEAGWHHSCFLTTSGDVWCWGENAQGQLGNGRFGVDQETPVRIEGLSDVAQLSAGASHTCALLSDKTVTCWGGDGWGQMGRDGAVPSATLTPVAISGLQAVQSISAGADHTCALLEDKTVKCWGRNEQGQIGSGVQEADSVDRPSLVVGLSDVVQIASGYHFSCALLEDGTARCWGQDVIGQLGDGDAELPYCDDEELAPCSHQPVTVAGISDGTQIHAGGYHSCAMREGGTVACWGYDHHGQLGDGNNQVVNCWQHVDPTTCRFSPVGLVNSQATVGMTLGAYHSCSWDAPGNLQCWGNDSHGQMGDGVPAAEDRLLPTALPQPEVKQVSAGGWHVCALLLDDSVQCWGFNASGQVGNDTTLTQLSPVDVVGLP